MHQIQLADDVCAVAKERAKEAGFLLPNLNPLTLLTNILHGCKIFYVISH